MPAAKKAVEAAPVAPADDWDAAPVADVLVECVSHAFPWTHTKALVHGEQATVPADIAAAMAANGHVKIVGAE